VGLPSVRVAPTAILAQDGRRSIVPAGRVRRPWNVLQYLPRHARQLGYVDRNKPRLAILLPIRPAACLALALTRLLLVELSLTLYCQHVPCRRHFLKFLFVTRVRQRQSKFSAFVGKSVVFQYSLHDAALQHITTKVTSSLRRAAVVRRRLGILQSLISGYPGCSAGMPPLQSLAPMPRMFTSQRA
jgi:hypothetical protein